MEKNDNDFDNKSESEKMRNVANLVHDIVNAKPEGELEVKEVKGEEPKSVEAEVTPLVDAVGKAISTHKPKGMFMHGVQTDDHPKL